MTGRSISLGGRAAAFCAIALIVVSIAPPMASAHGFLERSEPPNGGMVAIGRSSLSLWFSEPISAEASRFELQTIDGIQAALSVVTFASDGEGVVEIETGPLLKATYLLDWSVLSLDDGHRYGGSVLFGVGLRPEVAPSTTSGLPDGTGLLFRWFDLSLLMLAIGSLAVSGRVLRSLGEGGGVQRGRALYIGASAATGAVITGAMTPFLRMPQGGKSLQGWFEATRAMLTGTSWGRLWIAREVVLIVLVVLICLRVVRRDGRRGRWPLAVVPLAAAIGLGSWAGHASALPRDPRLAAIAAAFHIAAAGVWVGGLAVLSVVLLPMVRNNPDSRGPVLATAWRAFSPLAGVAAGLLVVTGLYQSGRHVPDMHSAVTTIYGRAVIAKVGLVAAALMLAAINTLLINPRLAAPAGRLLGRSTAWAPISLRRFPKIVAAETVVLIFAVGIAALATSVPTGRELATASAETAPRRANVEGLFVTVEVLPAGSGQSRLIVRTSAIARPQPGPIEEINVLLDGPEGTRTELSLDPTEPGRFEGKTAELTSGTWDVHVTVRRDGAPDAVVQAPWNVATAYRNGTLPLERATTALAIVALAGVFGAIRVGRRPRQYTPETTSREPATMERQR